VELRSKKANDTEKDTKTGIKKVMNYALYERGLYGRVTPRAQRKARTEHPLGLELGGKKYVEGTRDVPEYGRPVPSGAANLLVKYTRKRAEEVQARELEAKMNA
jgi:hypothetical protein